MMNQEQKNSILSNLSRIEANDLFDFINSGQISFEELRATGKLTYEKQEIIRTLQAKEEEKFTHEKNDWQETQDLCTKNGYKHYIEKYPNGIYVTIAKTKIDELQRNLEQVKINLLDDIFNNPDDYSAQVIKDKINDGIIDQDDLIQKNIITKDALKWYFNPPTFFTEQLTWHELKPLPDSRTDVYVFGIPRSGKSCILAGLLYKGDQDGCLMVDEENEKGFGYAEELRRAIEIGYVPPSTSTDQVNYISCQIFNEKREHQISIVEMSGEFFNRTYLKEDLTNNDSIGAKGYLQNDNRKVIFFVIDYFKHLIGTENVDMASQKAMLNFVLGKLDKDGTLAKTDSIQVIVSKCDLIPNSVKDRDSYVKQFLENNFNSFIQEVRRLNKKYNINATRNNNVVVHPFSLGKFMLGKTFIFDNKDSKNLLSSLINLTAHKRTHGFWTKLFNK